MAGLLQSNCHVDLIDWRGRRGFRGEGQTLDQLCDPSAGPAPGQCRMGTEVTGILSHHLGPRRGLLAFPRSACWIRCDRHPGVPVGWRIERSMPRAVTYRYPCAGHGGGPCSRIARGWRARACTAAPHGPAGAGAVGCSPFWPLFSCPVRDFQAVPSGTPPAMRVSERGYPGAAPWERRLELGQR